MTDPASRAKPVGPPPPGTDPTRPGPTRPGQGSDPTRPGQRSDPDGSSAGGPPPGGAQVRYYSWSGAGPSVPWFAILLLVLGVGLLFQELTGLGFIPVVVLALGVVFAVLWLWRGIIGATMPALVFIAWGGANVLADAGVVEGDGWSMLFVGVAFLIGWALARFQQARRTWALWIGTILAIIGLSEIGGVLPTEVDGAAVMGIGLIALGIFLIARSRLLQAR